jgi:site-specific DNA-cytosine methylase
LDDADVPEGTRLSPSDIEVLNLWDEVVVHFRTKGVKLPTFPMWSNDWDSTYDLTVVADEEDEGDEDEKEDEDEKDEKEDEKDEDEKEGEKAAPAASRGAVSTRYKIPLWKQKFIRQNRDFYAANSAFLGPWLRRARDTVGFTGAKRKLEWQAGKFQEDDSIWKLLFQFRPSGIRVKRANYSPALVAMAQIVYVGEKRRKLSPREVARLQSFPDSFRLPAAANVAYKQFGNSVNVEVIQYAARVLLSGV